MLLLAHNPFLKFVGMKLARSLFAAAVIGAFGITSFGLSRQHALAATISSGDLIRGQTYPAVYYMGADGFRYVFPNQKTYDTWYSDFNSVKFVTDAEIAKIQIGGNVTYKPGSRMIKIDSDPRTFAITQNGTLHWVGSENLAVSLYGAQWNKHIDDMPDGFFGNYNIGSPIESSADLSIMNNAGDVASINVDKGLKAATVFSISDTAYSPTSVHVTVGDAVRFTNMGNVKHTATGDDLTWGTGTLNPGESFIQVFKKAGTYTFFDSYNSALTGAVYVEVLP